MQLLLKLLLILQTGVQGGPWIGEITQPQLVSVLKGASVKINCTFIYNGSADHWVHAVWYWRSPGLPDTRYETKNLSCTPDIPPGGFSRCVVSLMIEDVSFDHSDNNYTCAVNVPTVYPPLERKGPGTRIQIYELPEVSTVDGALVAGRQYNLTCSAKGWYSANISFTWACHGINSSTNITTLTSKRTVNGTPVATSQLEIIPKVTDHGAICRCQISHVTFRQPVLNQIKLDVMYGPQDPIIMYRLNNRNDYHPGTSSSILVPTDSFLELRCSVDSNPASTVIWVKDTEMLQLPAGSNSSKVEFRNFQSEDSGVYWCIANNMYGWRNASVCIKPEKEGPLLLPILVLLIAVTGFIAVATIYFCLIWKKQFKDPANVSMELSPETMDRSANCNGETDTIYAVVRRNSLPSNPRHATTYANECRNVEEEDEEVPYADIVIYNPKRQFYNQQPKEHYYGKYDTEPLGPDFADPIAEKSETFINIERRNSITTFSDRTCTKKQKLRYISMGCGEAYDDGPNQATL
ncbi:sialic acid-binding Ig-like lectin 13 isoform X2 [Heterodontus francisci]|uniref:sialic acid-binding Ig-like lectin 13 isoform X2 n=1 Tax=Heterodontus francisci TaxID=7792 RepID=UPI00355C2002